MLAKYLSKNGGRVSKRGHTVSDAIDATLFYVGMLLVFGVVGSIESGRWFG